MVIITWQFVAPEAEYIFKNITEDTIYTICNSSKHVAHSTLMFVHKSGDTDNYQVSAK